VARAVADGFPFLNLAHLQHLGFQSGHRPHGVGLLRPGVAAVKADAGARQIALEAAAQNAGRIADAQDRARKAPPQLSNALQLDGVQRMLGLIGAGQMGD